ncbi:hypothetical protein [Planomonospora sp. ID82291]|uniref:hypothetical protein n=1 Tax=Planomonospora sp. ID82291 TaxID=2738136 RepID=UPI0018C3EF3C|nr:hypothetical protein [Planomonospora sp. ID82291]MBG0817192.1 hypothetical protein [Planomonospora sp. ID82291]
MRTIIRAFVALAVVTAGAACSQGPEPGRAATPPTTVASAPPTTAAPTAQWVAGQCIDARWDVHGHDLDSTASAIGVDAVPCSSGQAAARILKAVGGDEDAALASCPIATDKIRPAPDGGWICARNLTAPHPGDPGGGSGILRVGDCLYADGDDESLEPAERPCYDPHGPGKIRSFLKKKSQCRDREGSVTEYNTTRRDYSSRRVICHGDGAGVREPGPEFEDGTCVAEPAVLDLPLGDMVFGGLDQVSCGDEEAWAEVLGTVSEQPCPARATREVTGDTHYPGKICLRAL